MSSNKHQLALMLQPARCRRAVDGTSCGGRTASSRRLLAAASLLSVGLLAEPVLADTAPTPAALALSGKKNVKARKTSRTSAVIHELADLPAKAPVAAAPAPACGTQTAFALNSNYNIKGWNIPTPNFADSITQDRGCYRSILAKYGFGFVLTETGVFQDNLINHYSPSSNLQQYIGQRPTALQLQTGYLLYDLSRYGIPDGQLQIGGIASQTTWIGAVPNQLALQQLSYYQTLFNKRVELNIGYIPFAYQFVGTFVGGNVYNVLGPAATLPVLLGASSGSDGTPSIIAKFNITNRLYDKAAVIRSDPSSSVANTANFNPLQEAHYSNPSGFIFSQAPSVFGVRFPQERALFVNEIGYKNAAAPGDPFTWLRVTGFYNTTQYENLQFTNKQTTNGGVLAYADRQIFQTEPGNPLTAYRGIYVGAQASWVSPQANFITQDYGARIYTLGLFGRPKDQLSFIWEQEIYSPYIVDPLDSSFLSTSGTLRGRHVTNQYTLSYNINVVPGVFVGIGAAYVDHPTVTYSPNALQFGSAAAPPSPIIGPVSQLNVNHALNFLASVFVNL